MYGFCGRKNMDSALGATTLPPPLVHRPAQDSGVKGLHAARRAACPCEHRKILVGTCDRPEQARLPAAGLPHNQQGLPLTQQQVELLQQPGTSVMSA